MLNKHFRIKKNITSLLFIKKLTPSVLDLWTRINLERVVDSSKKSHSSVMSTLLEFDV